MRVFYVTRMQFKTEALTWNKDASDYPGVQKWNQKETNLHCRDPNYRSVALYSFRGGGMR